MEPRLLLGLARLHDMLNDQENAITYYKKVLVLDSSNIESIACLGAHYFYSDQVREVVYFHLLLSSFLSSLRCQFDIIADYFKWV
jgi:tetratricopeptide repeat protein 8